ncbi:MAG: N-Acetyl-D-glucosamine ABC transport system, permease protein, partial [uncultured Thermomicrobiales bacterium]
GRRHGAGRRGPRRAPARDGVRRPECADGVPAPGARPPGAAGAGRLPVLLRDLHLLHEPGRRHRRRVGRAGQLPLPRRPAELPAGGDEHGHPGGRDGARQARDRARPGAAAERTVPRPRPLPLAGAAPLGDARLRRVPRLAAPVPADRRRGQPAPPAGRAARRGHRLARPALDGAAGGDGRHRLARLPLLVYLVPGGAPERADRALRGGPDRRRLGLAALPGGDAAGDPAGRPDRRPALLDLDRQLLREHLDHDPGRAVGRHDGLPGAGLLRDADPAVGRGSGRLGGAGAGAADPGFHRHRADAGRGV